MVRKDISEVINKVGRRILCYDEVVSVDLKINLKNGNSVSYNSSFDPKFSEKEIKHLKELEKI